MANSSGPKSMDEQRWKCSLCYQGFNSELEKDIHMVKDCAYREPIIQDPLRSRRGSIGNSLSNNTAKKESSQSTGGSLKGKQSVLLTWIKQLDTCEREIYFFHKSGDMFTLRQEPQKRNTSTSSLTHMINIRFECHCEMEVGEHEGSLNLPDSGVYGIVPFKVKEQSKELTILIKIIASNEHKPKSTQVKGTPKTGVFSSQPVITKQTSRELDKALADIKTLKISHANEKEEFLKKEEKHKLTITQLKGRIADKDREISFREEKLKNLEEEMGRFSEKSHQIFDKYSEDKSKYDESETHLEEMRKELLKHKHMFTVLEKEKHQLEETNNALINQGEEFQNVILSLKSEREDLHNQCSMMRQRQQQIVTESTRTDEEILSLKQQIKQLKDIIAVKDNVIPKFSDSEVVTLQKKYSELERELRHLKDTTNPPNITHEERISGTTGRKIVSLEEKINELEMNLTLKTSECDDLKREVVSLKSELKEAQDLLASKLDRSEESEDLAGLSVSQSLGADFNRKDYSYHTQQSTDAELIRNLKTHLKEYQTQISNQSADISCLEKLIEEKFTENNILRTNLEDTLKELEKTKLQLKHTEENLSVTQSYLNKEQNPSKVQPKTETVAEKQPQYAIVAAKQTQPKYSLIKLMLNGKFQEFYSLKQVDDPNTLIGELILCRSKLSCDYVVGTLKVIIPVQYQYDKTIAGIEFIDPLGNSNGEFNGKRYFKTNHFCAIFLPINEVYMCYNKQTI